MNKLYPIKFIADPRERVWGGDYLIKGLKKDFDEEFRLYTLNYPNEEVKSGFVNFLLPFYTKIQTTQIT